jgi:hypothetical protein
MATRASRARRSVRRRQRLVVSLPLSERAAAYYLGMELVRGDVGALDHHIGGNGGKALMDGADEIEITADLDAKELAPTKALRTLHGCH